MITFKNVTYKVKNKTILNGISFNVKDGEKVLIMGESGSGKSTIFNLLLKNIDASDGNIYFDKEDISMFNEKKLNKFKKEKISIIYQKDDLFDYLTVIENLTMFYHLKDSEFYLKKSNLYHLKNRYIYSLSGGERQRIAIIKSCLSGSEVLLCDEITSALDYHNSKQIIDFILNMFSNKTIIFVSHDKSLFVDKIDRFIYLKNHKIAENIILNDILLNKIKPKVSKRKSLLSIAIKQGFKNISFSSFMLFIISVICFYINIYFNEIFNYLSYKSYSNYFDYDVVFIKDNNNIEIDNENILYDYAEFFDSCFVYLNNQRSSNIEFFPFNNKNDNSVLCINHKLLKSLNINSLKSIKLINDDFNCHFENINIIKENNMFTIPCIYYDVKYFNTLFDFKTEQLVIIDYDFTKEDNRFTNNPLFYEKEENMPYVDSKAYNDYLTFKMVFSSIEDIVNYYFSITFIYVFICSILYYVSILMKDVKVIAIYLNKGYSSLEILISYILPLIFYLSLSLIILIFNTKILVPLLMTFIIQLQTIFISFIFIRKKKLHDLLKEDILI